MKTSAIVRYEMALQLSTIQMTNTALGKWKATVTTRFPTPDSTLSWEGTSRRVRADTTDLRPVPSRRHFREGTFLTESGRTWAAFDLPEDTTTLTFQPDLHWTWVVDVNKRLPSYNGVDAVVSKKDEVQVPQLTDQSRWKLQGRKHRPFLYPAKH